MKKSLIIILGLLLMSMQFSCGGNKKAQESAYDDWEEHVVEKGDSTIFGICMDGSAMHSLQLLTDNGDTLLLDINHAQETNNLFGGYAVGDRMAVLSNSDHSQVSMVINLQTLLGDWVMINPLDGNSEIGMCIRDGGILESINQTNITYQTWRLVDGQLELVGVSDMGGNYEEADLYKFILLTPDSLTIGNADETLEFTRPGEMEDYSDIKLEDDSNEGEMIF